VVDHSNKTSTALGRLRMQDHEFKANLNNIAHDYFMWTRMTMGVCGGANLAIASTDIFMIPVQRGSIVYCQRRGKLIQIKSYGM
jgi:hypothetical protein